MADEATISAPEFLAKQAELESEAAQALPGKFDKCTFERGYCRQSVYTCLTCSGTDNKLGGFCYSCSISCHGDHEVLELFVKSHFRCDCGDSRKFPGTECSLRATTTNEEDGDETNENRYNHNFTGRYCWCNRFYDAEAVDAEVMLQCVLCEDWFHESCIRGDSDTRTDEPRLKDESCDFVCADCVHKCTWLLAYKSDYSMIPPVVVSPPDSSRSDLETSPKRSPDLETSPKRPTDSSTSAKRPTDSSRSDLETSPKRPTDSSDLETSLKRSNEEDESVDAKRLRSDDSTAPQKCTRPKTDHPLSAVKRCSLLFHKDLRSLICRCDQCMQVYSENSDLLQYTLLDDSPTVEPEIDEDANRPMYDVGMEALQQMEENKLKHCLSTVNAFNSEFREFLRPFGVSGRVVTKQDIEAFFQTKRSERN